MKRRIAFILGIILLIGCQSVPAPTVETVEYMNLETYMEESGNEVFEIQETIKVLSGRSTEGSRI